MDFCRELWTFGGLGSPVAAGDLFLCLNRGLNEKIMGCLTRKPFLLIQ